MKYSGTNKPAKKIAAYACLPACVFAALLLRSPANDVVMSDMPGGTARFTNRMREISPLPNRKIASGEYGSFAHFLLA